LKGTQQEFGVGAIAAVWLTGEALQFALKQRARTFGLTPGGEKASKTVCRA
jgi:hypothetical protein